MTASAGLAERIRTRAGLVGFWIGTDNPPMTERLARLGYDYLCLDAQHGLLDDTGCLRNLTAIDAGTAGTTVGMVRVAANTPQHIGRALDLGAAGVIVPLVNTPEEAAAAVRACRYPPTGTRSYGPVRSALRIGPEPQETDRAVACVVMIETREGLDNVDKIARVPGIDALYVGPSDLSLALGDFPPVADRPAARFAEALDRVRAAARAAGRGCGLHTNTGAAAAQALADGFTFASVSDDIDHLQNAARQALDAARGAAPATVPSISARASE
ncbi:aldolase/citrate lyase family protein [Streptomyces sp. NPDC005538]|uniref:HpcH/HpaI aldolase family protein n=1 Tax=unclassified Streptomyces TaxID=2593676 RepID=UPI0033B89ED2